MDSKFSQKLHPLNLNVSDKKAPENLEKNKESIRIATEKDWQAYRDLTIEAIDSPDSEMLGFIPGDKKSESEKQREKAKTERQWKKILEKRDDMFVLLSWSGSKIAGFNAAIRKRNNNWYIHSGYVSPEFRGGLGKRMFAARLNEIRNRGGIKVWFDVKSNNGKTVTIAETFGFEEVFDEGSFFPKEFRMELKNVNALEVIKKINEVLNAG